MAIIPAPETNPLAPPQDKWADASFFDVTLVHMVEALAASGKYTPGPLLMELALSATANIMIQTGRWNGPDIALIKGLDAAVTKFQRWS